MAGFLKKLFGGGSGGEGSGPSAEPAEAYGDCMIQALPQNAGGSWRVGGMITKEVDGETLERPFVRADTFPSQEEARSFSLVKAKQIIDQNDKMLFSDGAKSRPA
ncbi:MAG: HlyU family transcriptional regulator [Hyphomicrobiales bacterium]